MRPKLSTRARRLLAEMERGRPINFESLPLDEQEALSEAAIRRAEAVLERYDRNLAEMRRKLAEAEATRASLVDMLEQMRLKLGELARRRTG